MTATTPQNCTVGYMSHTAVSLTATVPPGYSFGGWYSTAAGSFSNAFSNPTTFTPVANAIVTATFVPVGGGGTCSTGIGLPLIGGRFVATLSYTGYGPNPPSGAGTGHTLSDNVGYFGTVDPDSLDVLVKIVDFCAENGSWGVYIGGTTDLNTVVSITDTWTGKVSRAFVNLLGQDFQLVKSAEFSCAAGSGGPIVGGAATTPSASTGSENSGSPGIGAATFSVPFLLPDMLTVKGYAGGTLTYGVTGPTVDHQFDGKTILVNRISVSANGNATGPKVNFDWDIWLHNKAMALTAGGSQTVPGYPNLDALTTPSAFTAGWHFADGSVVLSKPGPFALSGVYDFGTGTGNASPAYGGTRVALSKEILVTNGLYLQVAAWSGDVDSVTPVDLTMGDLVVVLEGSITKDGGCPGAASTGTTLPLVGGRFLATLNYVGYGANPPTGAGTGHRLTDNVGYFGTVDPTSADVAVKIVDFCSLNGTWGVYIGGATDLNTSVTITDTSTGKVSQPFVNALGHDFKLMKAGVFACP